MIPEDEERARIFAGTSSHAVQNPLSAVAPTVSHARSARTALSSSSSQSGKGDSDSSFSGVGRRLHAAALRAFSSRPDDVWGSLTPEQASRARILLRRLPVAVDSAGRIHFHALLSVSISRGGWGGRGREGGGHQWSHCLTLSCPLVPLPLPLP
jgi:hypothetical protein